MFDFEINDWLSHKNLSELTGSKVYGLLEWLGE